MKLHHLRPGRVVIKIASFFQKHLLAIALGLTALLLFVLGTKAYTFLSNHNVKPIDLLSFFGTPSEQIDSTDGATNFLLLGIRGEGSDSPNLSDTIIIVSYDHQTKTPVMIGVPRDLWVPSIKAKINTAYHYGEEASPSAGIAMSQAAVLEDLGIPIHYTAVVNFSLFKETIDLLGGVDVNVESGFTDNEFPIPGKENVLPIADRYETISFATGSAHFDGNTALKFVRSRHSTGEEGTDFARSRRQQLVITAIRQKMLTPAFLLDKNKIDAFFALLGKNLRTNIPERLYPTLAKIALDTRDNPVHSVAISDRPDENGVAILYNPPLYRYFGEWVLIPKDNNWEALKKYIANKIKISLGR